MMRKLLLAGLLAVLSACGGEPVYAQQAVVNCAYNLAHSGAVCDTNPLGMASAVESSRVLKASPGVLVGFQANNTNSSARWVLVFDATTAPSDGTVTGCTTTSSARPCLMKAYQVSGNNTTGVSWAGGPLPIFPTGIVFVCSSTGPFTKTATADCTFSGEAN